MQQQQVLNQKLMKLVKKVSLIKKVHFTILYEFYIKCISLSSTVAIKEKSKTGGKKGTMATKGVEHDAMGMKWNKSMWDNMESKNLFSIQSFTYYTVFENPSKMSPSLAML